MELKGIKNNLEKYLEIEKNNVLILKNAHSKKVFQMTEDMILIKNEWEKKCEEQVQKRITLGIQL